MQKFSLSETARRGWLTQKIARRGPLAACVYHAGVNPAQRHRPACGLAAALDFVKTVTGTAGLGDALLSLGAAADGYR